MILRNIWLAHWQCSVLTLPVTSVTLVHCRIISIRILSLRETPSRYRVCSIARWATLNWWPLSGLAVMKYVITGRRRWLKIFEKTRRNFPDAAQPSRIVLLVPSRNYFYVIAESVRGKCIRKQHSEHGRVGRKIGDEFCFVHFYAKTKKWRSGR